MNIPQPTRRDLLVALLLLVLSFTALGLAQRTTGVTRDEGTYFDAARSYWAWISSFADNWGKSDSNRAMTEGVIHRHWSVNREHPALMKSLFGASWQLFHQTSWGADEESSPREPVPRGMSRGPGPLSEISALRLPGWLFTALGVALLYLFGVRIHGRVAGLSAALLYLTVPRVFFHGQLACFDSGIATLWLFVVYAYYRSLTSARWGLLAGLVFGLALATKHNAWFLPPLLLIHYLAVIRRDVSLHPFCPPRIPLAFVSMAVLGPLVFLGHWPWMWFDTLKHLQQYVNFHLHHAYYNIEFLGTNFNAPPFPPSYPFVMTLFTVPVVTLLLMAAGVWVYSRTPLLTIASWIFGTRPPRHDDPFRYLAHRSWVRPADGLNPKIGTLLLLNAAFPIVLIALPQTPIFGGTKHWLPAYPFIALLAGVAVGQLASALQLRGKPLRALALALPLLVALPGAVNTRLTHPFGLSQYNALAGGPAGGADKGLNRQFWGYAPRQLLPWINDTLVDNARVYFHDVNHASYRAYIRGGLLRPDIAYSGMELPGITSSGYAMVIHEMHFNKYDYWIWDAFGSPIPSQVLTLDGVPLVSVYERPSVRDDAESEMEESAEATEVGEAERKPTSGKRK